MTPYICGKWDGVSLWLQWAHVPAACGYLVQVGVRPVGGQAWETIHIGGGKPIQQGWVVLPTWREGFEAQAFVALAGQEAESWEKAQEVTFLRSRCKFEFRAGPSAAHWLPGTEFMSVVDGASCVYVLQQEVFIEPGASVEVDLIAADLSGYCQLDHPGDFMLRPSLGLTIRNIAASEDDVQLTGRGFTVLAREERGPVRVVATGVNYFRGGLVPAPGR